MSGWYLALGLTLGAALGTIAWRHGGLSALSRRLRYLQPYRMPAERAPGQPE